MRFITTSFAIVISTALVPVASAQSFLGDVPSLHHGEEYGIFGPVPNMFALLSAQRSAMRVPFPIGFNGSRRSFLQRSVGSNPLQDVRSPLGRAPAIDTSRMLEWVPSYGFSLE